MEKGHSPVKRGISWTGHATTTHGTVISREGNMTDRSATDSWENEKHSWVKETSSAGGPARKTNLGRSTSLSEKDLKEARTQSQIIAAQLTVPSNPNSRGVQLFNRRRERVNAFTLVSVAGGGGERSHQESHNEPDSPSPNTLTWNRECPTDSPLKDLKHRRSEKQHQWPTVITHSKGHTMEEAGEVAHEVGDSVQERHFLPVNDKDEEIPEHGEEGKDVTSGGDDSDVASNPNQERQQEVQLNGSYESPLNALKAIPNGSHSTETNSKGDNSATKQSSITNRTARPFFSSDPVNSSGASSISPDIPVAPSYSIPPLPAQHEPPATAYSGQEHPTFVKPAFEGSSRQVFSPPPPAPLYPTPPLPGYMSLPQSIPSDPPPPSAMSPPPSPAYYTPLTTPSSTYVPQLLSDMRSVTPIRTGVLDEGRSRRSNRKPMFTFQEKPKLAPNPELLSLVQGADEKKRGKGQAETQEEEQLALGAEASNFLVKNESGVEESLVPEWASTLKSSRTRARIEHKPEQSLTNASGRGAELFAKRQTRMEKYVHENAEGLRSPSPTTSLPPSWVYPSNMPGRVKAMINASNITTEISKTLQAQHNTQKKNMPAKAPVPAPVLEDPALENGCSRVEMELSRHQPYQLNSSLFILNPVKDPVSTLPKAAPPPKSVVIGSSYSKQASLPSTPIPTQYDSYAYRSAHCFSPPMTPLEPVSRGVTSPVSVLAPERVTSARSAIQAPKPTFSTKKAGITPQAKDELPVAPQCNSPSSPTPWTPNLSRRLSNTDRSPGAVWTPGSQHSSLVTSPPPRTIHNPINFVPSSPPPPPRSIHNSMTCSPNSGSIHNPVTSSLTPRSIQNPISPPPTPRPFHNPVTSSPTSQSISSSPTPRPFKSSVSIIPVSRPTNNRTATTPVSPPWETRCQSPVPLQETKANHRLLAKNIINAAKRKNSLSPGALSGHGLLMSPVSSTILPFETKPPSPFQSRSLGAQSPTFTSPPATPTQMVQSPLRLYTTRSLTDSDASLESEDSGLRSPGVRSYSTCPRGWSGSLRLKRGGISEDL